MFHFNQHRFHQSCRFRGLFVPILLLIILAASCSRESPISQAPSGHRLKVTATFSILADWVRAVGGDRIDLDCMVGPDQDTHAWEPAPRDQILLGSSELVFSIGLGFETWLDKLVASSASKARVVEVSKGMDLIRLDGNTTAQPGDASRTEFDPHVWHSAGNARIAIETIARSLGELDREGAEGYRQRASAYLQKLDELDAWIRTRTAGLPVSHRCLLTNHDTFAYFARDYGFTLLLSAFQGISTQGADPSARQRGDLVERMKSSGVPAVFAENMANPKILEQAAREAGVRLAPPLYTDALGPAGSPAADYLGLMRYNVDTMVQSLSETK